MKQLRISTVLTTSAALLAVTLLTSTVSAQSGSRNVVPSQNIAPAQSFAPAQRVPAQSFAPAQNFAPVQNFAPSQTFVPSRTYVPQTYRLPTRVYRYPIRSYYTPRFSSGYTPLRNYRPFSGRRYFGGCGY